MVREPLHKYRFADVIDLYFFEAVTGFNLFQLLSVFAEMPVGLQRAGNYVLNHSSRDHYELPNNRLVVARLRNYPYLLFQVVYNKLAPVLLLNSVE